MSILHSRRGELASWVWLREHFYEAITVWNVGSEREIMRGEKAELILPIGPITVDQDVSSIWFDMR
jgi:hypothetical protein